MSTEGRETSTSSLVTALSDWFARHGKVVFVVATFDILLIVSCVVYWNMGLPMNPLQTAPTINKSYSSSWFPSTNMFDSLNVELSGIVYKFYIIMTLHLMGVLYILYSLLRIQHNQEMLLQKIYELGQRFIEHDVRQTSNMQTICRFVNRNQDHCNDVLDAISGLRTIHENEYRISLNAMNKIKQEMRTMRFEYHNEENETPTRGKNSIENTSVETITPVQKTRRRKAKTYSDYECN